MTDKDWFISPVLNEKSETTCYGAFLLTAASVTGQKFSAFQMSWNATLGEWKACLQNYKPKLEWGLSHELQ